ncbi:MAG: ribosome maturation factor RimM [Gammaproteobacteria bacterium]|nr:ribosome maturation factor RimM [Gammaproteobacteria bacterium]
MPDKSEELQILGKITGYFGVKGWVKIYSYTEPRDNIVRYRSLQIKPGGHQGGHWQAITLDVGKAHGKGVVAHFSGYDNREIAASLIGAKLAVQRSCFKAAQDDEYYWADLIKLSVVNLDGIKLGRVTHLMETAAHDVLIIRPEPRDGEIKAAEEILIPFVLDHYVLKVDLDAGVITVDWPADWNDSNEKQGPDELG